MKFSCTSETSSQPKRTKLERVGMDKLEFLAYALCCFILAMNLLLALLTLFSGVGSLRALASESSILQLRIVLTLILCVGVMIGVALIAREFRSRRLASRNR